MLFRPELIEEIKAGHKHQTRRTIDDYDLVVDIHGSLGATDVTDFQTFMGPIKVAMKPSGRAIVEVGKIYAMCPGRGKPGVGHIRVTAIRYERLQDISDLDLLTEGIDFTYIGADQKEVRRWKFQQLWDKLNDKPGKRWADNPLIRVVTFELVKQ